MTHIDVVEFARISGKSEQYIRKLCRENKLPYIQEYVEQNGKHKYLIDIESYEAKKILSSKQESQQNNEVSQQVSQQVSMPTNIDRLVDELIETRKKIEEYAISAGQVKLLTDNLKTKEHDEKYWQEKYFEKENEVKNLIKLNAQLESANKQLQMRLEQVNNEKNILEEEDRILKSHNVELVNNIKSLQDQLTKKGSFFNFLKK